MLGQGISEDQSAIFEEKLSYFDEHERCPGHLTHKVKYQNTLISDPKKIDEDYYRSLLMIDEDCAELSDHVTGKHIQFMVLIEAARQMVNAVTEKYYSDRSKIFLAKNIGVQFSNFVYPFKTEMNYKVLDKKIKIGGNREMSVEIEFVQWGKSVSKFNMTFTILSRDFVTELENKSINSAIYGA